MSDTFGGGLNFGVRGGATAPPAEQSGNDGADVTPASSAMPAAAPQAPDAQPTFGSGFGLGPNYHAPDPAATALDQTADTLNQRIQRANSVATNPLLQLFNPEGVQKARDFVPQATEALQKIKAQKADMQANRQQAATLGLTPGEVPDEASMTDRVEVAKAKALSGDLKVFRGLQAVDPKSAEAIQDQVHEVVAGHLTKAQLAFDSLSAMQNQGQYTAKLNALRKDGTITDLEALGLKVPDNFDGFNSAKAKEGRALREARIGVDTIRQKLEERNTYQPMEEKEAKTYNGRMTTVYGDQVTNGTWARNGAAGTRGLVVNGAGDPRDLGKSFTLGTDEQRKSMRDESALEVTKPEVEKNRAFSRTYQLATTDSKGNAIPADAKNPLNTNPNVQQGIAEGLASMLRGGGGGATAGLLKIESGKRAYVQTLLDTITANYAGGVNALSGGADPEKVKPYLTQLTQNQQRQVLDAIKAYNDQQIGSRIGRTAERAGALGFDANVFGYGKGENGEIDDAIERGRQGQIARMLPNHQAIGGGDGVFQLGAQRPGTGATGAPAGTSPTTQLPGAQPLQTPVQQATTPGAQPPITPAGGGQVPPSTSAAPAGPQGTTPPGGAPGPAGGSPAPMTIAGQPVNVPLPPGVSPNFVPALQRIESGNSKDPWTATTPGSSASGAYQFIDKTWNDNKPAGAPDRAKDATPAQQSQAFATLIAKNAQSLQSAGLPVNDTSLYVAHNLGATGASTLLKANPNADARSVVGETAARNNPLFFRGRPTVATVLQRYQTEMDKTPGDDDVPKKPLPGSGGVRGDLKEPDGQPSFLQRISRALSQGVPGSGADKDAAAARVGTAATENAPAIGSTLGAIGGSAAGPAGTVAGGAAGGGAGQALKDYLQGNAQSPTEIAKQAALGGVLGVGGAARPVVSTVARVAGAGAVEGGATAAEGGSGADITDATLKGVGEAAGGEAFGRALGMVGHKVFTMFAPDARKAVQAAAKTYSEASETLKTETPTLPGVGTAAGGANPKYAAAEAAKEQAETTLKDAGLKPDEAAYAHKVSTPPPGSEPVPKREAEVARPGELEQQRIGAGYQQLESEVGAAGKGAPKAAPKLPDGPIAAVESKAVSAKHAELAQRTEMAITAPAANWQEKWNQLKDARSALLQAERDAQTSTAPGRTREAQDMRKLADTVRAQQAKAANYVFGAKDGPVFMDRLRVLDVRYRNLMEATNGGDLTSAARLQGEAGRDADRKFRAFAHDDPAALQAWTAMRSRGPNTEQGVHDLVAAEKIPFLGKAFSAIKLMGSLNHWLRERTAGSAVSFSDMVKADAGAAGVGQNLRDLAGTAAQRGAVQ